MGRDFIFSRFRIGRSRNAKIRNRSSKRVFMRFNRNASYKRRGFFSINFFFSFVLLNVIDDDLSSFSDRPRVFRVVRRLSRVYIAKIIIII